MAASLVVNGVTFQYPQTGDKNWSGTNGADAWASAVTSGMLSKAGGTFTLTADAKFGLTFGLVAKYFTSQSASPAGSGVLRLANSDGIGFRNVGGTADLLLQPDADGILQYNSIDLANISTAQTFTNKTIAAASNTISGLTNSNLSGSAAVSNANLAQMAANTLKGNNTGSTASSADLTIAQVQALLSIPLSSAPLPLNAGGTGTSAASANAAFNALSPMTTAGDLIYGGTAGAATRLAATTNGFVLTLASGLPVWAAGLSSALTSANIFVGNSSNVATAVAMSGDVAISNTGATTIQAGTVTLAKQANLAANSIVGNNTGSPTTPIALTTAQLKAMTNVAPTIQKFTTTGATTGYLFTITTSSTCSVNDTYTNNGHTYTVLGALAAQSGQVLFMSGAGAPAASGNLLVSVGSGTGTIAFTSSVALGTYTTPAGVLYLRVKMVGGGGGGAGAWSSTGTAGGPGGVGGTTAFGAGMLLANGGIGGLGSGGSPQNSGSAGGTASLGTVSYGLALTGGGGQGGSIVGTAASSGAGISGCGGNSAFGGSGGGQNIFFAQAGSSGVANTGGGGGGGPANNNSSTDYSGGGGGAGGYVGDAIISSPVATYYYVVGTGGTAGAAGNSGTGAQAGGAGGSGVIFVEEFYQ